MIDGCVDTSFDELEIDKSVFSKKIEGKSMVIAIDFDGTIVEFAFPKIGAPIKDSKHYINKLYDDGHTIVIWTGRTTELLMNAVKFLNDNQYKYHSVNQNQPPLFAHPGPKIYADVYIDDLGILGIPSWEKIYHIIQQKK